MSQYAREGPCYTHSRAEVAAAMAAAAKKAAGGGPVAAAVAGWLAGFGTVAGDFARGLKRECRSDVAHPKTENNFVAPDNNAANTHVQDEEHPFATPGGMR